MDERILKWLYDLSKAITEIESFFVNIPKDFEYYQSNILLKRAIERDLEIIGEAVNGILERDPKFPLEHAKKLLDYEIILFMLMTISLMKISGQLLLNTFQI